METVDVTTKYVNHNHSLDEGRVTLSDKCALRELAYIRYASPPARAHALTEQANSTVLLHWRICAWAGAALFCSQWQAICLQQALFPQQACWNL